MANKAPEKHYDIFGNELIVGRFIVTHWNNSLQVCIIDKLAPKMIQIRKVVANNVYQNTKYRYPKDCVLVPNDEEVTMYCLRNANG